LRDVARTDMAFSGRALGRKCRRRLPILSIGRDALKLKENSAFCYHFATLSYCGAC